MERVISTSRRRSNKLLTMIVTPALEGKAREKRFKGTRFVQNWPKSRTVSNWYFLTKKSERIFLKIGWNLFGRRDSNNIQIKRSSMKSCELYVFVPKEKGSSPVAYSVNNNCIMDGIRMGKKPSTLYHRSVVGIVSGLRVVFIEFRTTDALD